MLHTTSIVGIATGSLTTSSMTPSMKRTREHQKGETRSLHGFVLALMRIKRLRATFIVQSMLSLSIRSSREE